MPSFTSLIVHGNVGVLVMVVCVHLWLLLTDDIDRFWQHMLGMFGGSALAIVLALVGLQIIKAEASAAQGHSGQTLPLVVAQTCWAALCAVGVLLAVCAIRQEVLRATVYALVLTMTFWLTAKAMTLHTLLGGWSRIGDLAYALMAFAACLLAYEVCQRAWRLGLRNITA